MTTVPIPYPPPVRLPATSEPRPYHPRTIGIVDPPLATTELPLFAQYAAQAAGRHRPRHRKTAAHSGVVLFTAWTLGAISGQLILMLALLTVGAGW